MQVSAARVSIPLSEASHTIRPVAMSKPGLGLLVWKLGVFDGSIPSHQLTWVGSCSRLRIELNADNREMNKGMASATPEGQRAKS